MMSDVCGHRKGGIRSTPPVASPSGAVVHLWTAICRSPSGAAVHLWDGDMSVTYSTEKDACVGTS